ICAFLLGATWPILAALPGAPAHILAGDAYLATQGSGAYSVNESLADNLTAQPWARIVSPEILSLGTLHGEPVLVRAANPVALCSDLPSAPPIDARGSKLRRRTGHRWARLVYLSAAVEGATGWVGVVASGIAVLLGGLVAFGIHAGQTGAFPDGPPAIGDLRA